MPIITDAFLFLNSFDIAIDSILCVVNRYEPLFLKKEEKKWYNSDVSLETEP